MRIEGWAFEKDASVLSAAISKRYNEIKALGELVRVETISNGYASKTYRGTCPNILSERDLAIYLDSGNLCFGGVSSIDDDGNFTCTIYID